MVEVKNDFWLFATQFLSVFNKFDTCDVIVADGFTGNIFLKGIEGFGKLLLGKLKEMFYSNTATKLAALSMKKQIDAMKKQFDPSEHGGSPILGISKPVVKAHGSSNAKAFKNAIGQAIRYAESGMIEELTKEIAVFAEKAKKDREAASDREAGTAPVSE